MRTQLSLLKKKTKYNKVYQDLIRQMQTQIDKDTLEKYEILKKGWDVGIKLYGNKFNLNQLASDFNMAWSTVKRIMSLKRANKKAWDMINSGKISAYKVAMICSTKNSYFQDEIVKEVVEQDLSCRDIKEMKINNIQDMNDYRFKRAIKKNYTNKQNAYGSFSNALTRLVFFLMMDINALTKTKQKEIILRLKKLNKQIEEYIKKNS